MVFEASQMSDELKLDILKREVRAGIHQLEASRYETFSEGSASSIAAKVKAKALRQKTSGTSGEKSADADGDEEAR